MANTGVTSVHMPSDKVPCDSYTSTSKTSVLTVTLIHFSHINEHNHNNTRYYCAKFERLTCTISYRFYSLSRR